MMEIKMNAAELQALAAAPGVASPAPDAPTILAFQSASPEFASPLAHIPILAAASLDADAYRAGVLADELALADLLGWRNIQTLEQALGNPSRHLFGSLPNGSAGESTAGGTFMPRWRRDWDAAGALIGRCGLSVTAAELGASAGFGYGTSEVQQFTTLYEEYPTKDDAIRACVCRAARAFLVWSAA